MSPEGSREGQEGGEGSKTQAVEGKTRAGEGE